MTEALYLRDSYMQRFPALVDELRPDGVVLDRTAFDPGGGGQPEDHGSLSRSSGEASMVAGAVKADGVLVHHVDPSGFSQGDRVEGRLDWPRRYAHMRFHTALHILSGAVFRTFGSGITGGQIYADRARMDFSLPAFGRETAAELLDQVNDVIRRDVPIRVRFVSREDFDSDPTLVRVDRSLLPADDPVRLIDIEGYDVQADGGTHVASTAEVGHVELDRIENKGAKNKRLYLRARDPSEPTGAGPVAKGPAPDPNSTR